MAKYVPDIMTRRWVIISSGRSARPVDYEEGAKTSTGECPFCEGNEALTPAEIFRIGGGEKDKPGWKVRVIPNRYPITDMHEIIIHTPECGKDIYDSSQEQVEALLKAYRDRFNFHRKTGQVLIFCNHGESSGASIKHPHSQLVVIPFQINLDTLTREPLNNIVEDNDFFNIYCPDFSQWPYEVWITPKKENTVFGDINDEEISDLAGVFKTVLSKLETVHRNSKLSTEHFSYNFYIHPKENWYLRIIPRFVHRAGFELGTGLSVNIVDPTNAALELQEIESKERMDVVVDRLKKLGERK